MKKQKDELAECRQRITESISRWKHINKNGCNDPSWPDGVNMNLVRNHIIWYKRRLEELCAAAGTPLPEEYYLPTPPEVDKNYMANLKQEARVQRLTQMGSRLNTKKIKYDDSQMSFA